MRLEMPDGTAVMVLYHEDGVVVATQGARRDTGLPKPSGVVVTGESAELLGALLEVVEEVEVEEILGSS